jgi:hypothetical protein
MKIPETIRIGGIDYDIKKVQNLNNREKLLRGNITYADSTIRISASDGHQYQCVTLWHEMLHAISAHANLNLGKNEEQIIDTFAYGIYQVLQDNGKKLFDIKEDS